MKSNGYGFFFATTFSFLKSIQILSLIFLGTTIMGDNHVASSTKLINQVANNLSIFRFTIVA